MDERPRHSIGVLLPSLGGIYFSAILRGIQSVASRHNLEVLAFQGFTPERICQTRLGLERVAGWVVVLEAWWTQELLDYGRPVVTIAAPSSAASCPAVVVDNRGGVHEAVRHLVAHGHRRIAFTGYLVQDDIQERLEGYRAGLAEAGIAFDPALVIPLESNALEEGRVAGRRLLELGMPCSAVMAAADWNAIGLIEELRGAGYRVPEDLAVVGFDDLEASALCEPALTTVRQHIEELGQRAGELLLAQCAGHELPPQIVRLPTELVVRGSCGCRWQGPAGPAEADRADGAGPSRQEHALARNHYLEELLLRSYRITATLFKEGAQEIAQLDWLSKASASWGCVALWAGSDDDRLRVTGVYDPHSRLAPGAGAECDPEHFPPPQRLQPATPGQNEIVQVLRIRSHAQPPLEEWGFLVVASEIDTYTSLKEWYTTREGEQLEMWAAMLGEALHRESILSSLTQAKQAAENATRLKMQFLTNISHELRTPLNAIIGFADLLDDLVASLDLPQEQASERAQIARFLERIGWNGSHLLGLINDILDLARLDAGRVELEPEQADLRRLLQSVMASAPGLIAEAQVELRLQLPEALPDVLMDARRVRQVLLNLLSNAARFTRHGSITLRALLEEQGFVTVEVKDTGSGIPAEYHELIFEEFRQLDTGLPGKHGGTGLGLAISRRLVELHGGRMWVESAPGAGSAFRFTLPLLNLSRDHASLPPPSASAALSVVDERRQRPSQAAHDAPARADGRAVPEPALRRSGDDPSSVLVVDDHPDTREILRFRLETAGYHVLQASDGLLALDVIRERRPDLIILDLMLPRMDGFALLEALQRDPPSAATPVIVLTAQVLSEQELARLNQGASAVLEKGILRTEEILAQVQTHLSGSHRLKGSIQQIVHAAMTYIHDNYAEQLSRDEIAAHAGVSTGHLARCFQQELGISPMTYLTRYRIRQARLLLERRRMSVAEVAQAVGFANEFYFSRVFRREEGVAPGAYRRGVRRPS